jgi:hypothetical protein
MPVNFEEIQEQLEEHEKRLSQLEKLVQGKPKVLKKKLSMREFILDKKPQNDVHKALAIGYYLEKYDGFSCFTSKEIEKGFRRAREKAPSNVPDKIKQNRDNGHMMKADEQKDKKMAYVLTNPGTAFVENGFTEEE